MEKKKTGNPPLCKARAKLGGQPRARALRAPRGAERHARAEQRLQREGPRVEGPRVETPQVEAPQVAPVVPVQVARSGSWQMSSQAAEAGP